MRADFPLKWSLGATVGALPANSAAGETPQIFFHARVAYLKTAGAYPAKRLFLAATGTQILPFFPVPLIILISGH